MVSGYSGNLDFTNELNACIVDYTLVPVREGEYPHGAGQMWADADVDQAAWYMRRLVAEPSYGAGLGRVAGDFIRSHCGAEAVGRRYRARLDRLRLPLFAFTRRDHRRARVPTAAMMSASFPPADPDAGRRALPR